MSVKRVQKELLNISTQPIDLISVIPPDDISTWSGEIKCPKTSIYATATLKFILKFPVDYPFKPPCFTFVTKIYHPNVDERGAICLQLLKPEVWKPATTVREILHTIAMLIDEPNPDDPLDLDIANVYITDIELFRKTAEEYVLKYAQ